MDKASSSGLHARPFSFVWIGTLLLALMFVLAACGNSNASPGPGTPTTTSGNPYGQSAPTTGITPTTVVATPTSAPGPGGPIKTVTIVSTGNLHYGFSPATLTVTVGTTVIWKNSSRAPHTVTSDDGQAFASNAVSPNETFSFTFTKAGTFKYHCEFHPYMIATIIVQ